MPHFKPQPPRRQNPSLRPKSLSCRAAEPLNPRESKLKNKLHHSLHIQFIKRHKI
nr:MAG TPA: hypothetical protein [Caudoviricetes sp.]